MHGLLPAVGLIGTTEGLTSFAEQARFGETFAFGRIRTMRRSLALAVVSLGTILSASTVTAMDFRLGGTDHRAPDAAWIQASGPIKPDTPDEFRAFVAAAPDWYPKRVRLHSTGGDLESGILLGRMLRAGGYATEVGSDETHPDWTHVTYWRFTRRTPGTCASACAYAFLGGVERRVEEGSRLGFHQFYRREPAGGVWSDPGNAGLVPAGEDQTIAAQLLAYVLEMGIAPNVLVYAGLTPPSEMFWLDAVAAADLGISWDPTAWRPWSIQPFDGGVLAQSVREDGLYEMGLHCSSNGMAMLDVIFDEGANPLKRDWLEHQCVPNGDLDRPGHHSVMGVEVPAEAFSFSDLEGGGFRMRINLGRSPELGPNPSLFWGQSYPSACTTHDLKGSRRLFLESAHIALANCRD